MNLHSQINSAIASKSSILTNQLANLTTNVKLSSPGPEAKEHVLYKNLTKRMEVITVGAKMNECKLGYL